MMTPESIPNLSPQEQELVEELVHASKQETDYAGYPVEQVLSAAQSLGLALNEEDVILQAAAAIRSKEQARRERRKYFDVKGPTEREWQHGRSFTPDTRPAGINQPGRVTPLLFHYVVSENVPGAHQELIDTLLKENPAQTYQAVMTALGNDPTIRAVPVFGLRFELKLLPRLHEAMQQLMAHLEPVEQRQLQRTWQESIRTVAPRAERARQQHRLHYNIDDYKELGYTEA